MNFINVLIFSIIISFSAFASSENYREIGIDPRLEGVANVLVSTKNATTTHYIDFTFDGMFNGIEFYAHESYEGDYIDIYIEYLIPPSTWRRYKKFAKNFNIFPNILQKYVLTTANVVTDSRIRIDYTSKSTATDAKLSLNKFQFVTSETVIPPSEGTDW